MRHNVDKWCDSGCGRRENDSAFPTFTKQVIVKSYIINDVKFNCTMQHDFIILCVSTLKVLVL